MIWNITEGKLINTIQAHRGGITAMGVFKGFASEFRTRLLLTGEKHYLCSTGGMIDPSI